MFNVFIESIHLIVVIMIIIIIRHFRKSIYNEAPLGYQYILYGFYFLFFAALLDLSDNFIILNKFIIFGDTAVEAFLEKITGYTLGYLFLFLGFYQIFPIFKELVQTKRDLSTLELAIENASEEVLVTNIKGIVSFANPAFIINTGYTNHEIVGKNINILNSGKHDKQFFATLWSTITSGNTWVGTITNKKKNGELFEEQVTISPILDKNKILIGYLSIRNDITEKKKLQSQLEQNQKMKSIGLLAGGIAHDFNNILTAIIGYNDLAMMESEKSPEISAHLNKVSIAANRAKKLVKQILTFSRKSNTARQPIQLSRIVNDALKLIRSTIPSTIEIVKNIESQSITIADVTEIHQIVMNLCTNASQAMIDNKGIIDIKLTDISIKEDEPILGASINPGNYIELEISDNGRGIDKKEILNIFDPYFTTKKVGSGTGLGLSVVHGIISNYGGYINVYSEIDVGTTFKIYFLKTQLESQLTMPKQKIFNNNKGTEKILVVDDEKSILDLAKKGLTHFGYKVTTFSNSIEAMEYFKTHNNDVDLVLTDMTMPNL
ncbi:MAG: PAS domain S-box protein, partial [Bacteroidales bacterium]|nr:PAS domain S-box protein [Bacteroidales bacterium]